jgi:pyruvate dehydrogenase E2 component (dihydrolipoamide acetyltransferase)
VNVGFAIVAEDVFLAPTVFDADKKLAPEIASELAALTARASTGELTPPELSGATFTVFYPGAYGVMQSSPVINPPQAAALSAGAIRETPIVRDGVILPGQVMVATLACDNRILYGVQAASFLKWIKDLLEDPTSL